MALGEFSLSCAWPRQVLFCRVVGGGVELHQGLHVVDEDVKPIAASQFLRIVINLY